MTVLSSIKNTGLGNFNNNNDAVGDYTVSDNGQQRLNVDTTGNVKLLNSAAAFQNSAGENFSPYAFRNKIINGNFDFWEYGTSQTVNGFGSDDRWNNVHFVSTKVHSLQAFTVGQTAVPNNPKYFSRTVVTSVAGVGASVYKEHKIENVVLSSGKTYTLTFWAQADTNRNIVVEGVQAFGSGGSASVLGINSTTIPLTTNWQKFTVQLSFPSVAGKTIGASDYFSILFWFDAGSNFDARTNSLGQQSGTFDIAQVQLEEGPVATPFENRPHALELSLCQRYFEVIRERDSVWLNTTDFYDRGWGTFKVQKRVPPTCSTWTAEAGFNTIRNISAGTNPTTTGIGANVNGVIYISTSGGTANQVGRWYVYAYAEL